MAVYPWFYKKKKKLDSIYSVQGILIPYGNTTLHCTVIFILSL